MNLPRLRFPQVLLLGLAARLLLAPIGAHPFDTYVFYDTAQRAYAGLPFYGTTQYSYPPTWAGILAIVDAVYRPLAAFFGAHPLSAAEVFRRMNTTFVLGSPLLADGLFLFLMKLPLIAGDVGLALLLRKSVARFLGDPRLADRAFAWYFLNPYILWISAVWGMFDVLPTLFAFLGVLLFLDRRDLASGLAFGLAISLKYFPIVVAIGILVAYRGTLTRGRLTRFGAGLVGWLGLVSVPFLLTDPGAYLGGILSPTSGSYVGRVSIWTFIDQIGVGSLPLWFAAAIILALLLLVAFLTSLWGRTPLPGVASALWFNAPIAALATFYVVNYAVNPQYFVWIVPFLILDGIRRPVRPWALIGVTVILLTYIVAGVQHFSFFLPMITLSPGLAPFVPRMPNLEGLTFVLALAVWYGMVLLLTTLVSRAGGAAAMRRSWAAIRAWFHRARPAATGTLGRPMQGASLQSPEPPPAGPGGIPADPAQKEGRGLR